MLEAVKYFTHFVRTLLPDMREEQTIATESFSTNEVELANPSVSHIVSVTTASGNNKLGYDWYFSNWGSKLTKTKLKLRAPTDTITKVVYKYGTVYCYPGYPHKKAKYPKVGIDYSIPDIDEKFAGTNYLTSENAGVINYNFTILAFSRTGEDKQAVDVDGSSYNEHAILDIIVEKIINGFESKGSQDEIPFPFGNLSAKAVSSLKFEEEVGLLHKDITVKGHTMLDIKNNRW